MKRKSTHEEESTESTHDAESTESRVIKVVVLVVLTAQNCSLMMVTSYSLALPGPKYLASTAVLAGEVVKTAVVFCVLAKQHGLRDLPRVLKQDIFSGGAQTARYAIPSIFYTLQNNLWYFAMSNLDSVTAAVTSQLKVISTAVFSMLILTKKLSHVHWTALSLLMLGLVVIEAEPEDGSSPEHVLGNYYLGILSMVAASTSSGYAGVYLELLFKQLNADVWKANLQLQIFCLPVAALAMLSDLPLLLEAGPLQGWNGITCAVVLLNALGGFVVSLTMKYADNILKTFAVSMSLVVNCLISSAFMSVSLTLQTIAGVALVIMATFLYSIANNVSKARSQVGGGKAGYLPVSTQLSAAGEPAVKVGASEDDLEATVEMAARQPDPAGSTEAATA